MSGWEGEKRPDPNVYLVGHFKARFHSFMNEQIMEDYKRIEVE